MKNDTNWFSLLACIIGVELVGIISSLFTVSSVSGWYQTLVKPVFNPPSSVFGPVWTILYAMIGISLYLVISNKVIKKKSDSLKEKAYWAFGIQLALNFLWSILFFGVHNIGLAFIEIIVLWLAILFNLIIVYKISKASFWLLVPYFIWVSFASLLNYSLLILN